MTLTAAPRCGVDLVHIGTVADLINGGSPTFATTCWTETELSECGGAPRRLASRWAAKEAVMKSLAQGIGQLAPTDIEVRTDTAGVPHILLHGPALARAQALGIGQFAVSLSEDADYAIAFVIAHAAADDRQPVHNTPTYTEVDDGQGG
ncbi:holo-ACP synthase [Arsenicicoccus bolidensis]|uniref:Holo-[acyl-carrier-protein] synthase n=1 Tax=Arsenicicoccus bolidensis TaxID=229480 RepID=A0ABS9Q0D9_9MICO|nr:holo-ACP synthase [Arsenicicoccus bolidensis]MCG7321349.1 holo-ACP synthase [Arsenicicoccus bolidensis]